MNATERNISGENVRLPRPAARRNPLLRPADHHVPGGDRARTSACRPAAGSSGRVVAVLLALCVLWGPNEANGDICGRTAGIRDLILAQLPGTACGDVTAQQLAGITVLDAENQGLTAVQASDCEGLVNLEQLNLKDNDRW